MNSGASDVRDVLRSAFFVLGSGSDERCTWHGVPRTTENVERSTEHLARSTIQNEARST